MSQKSPPSWYSIRRRTPVASAAAGAEASAEIYIYGDIGESWWEETISARSFIADLAALDATRLTVRINSFGGSVPDGIAIHNAIKRHPAQVDIEIDGVAYSIASLIAMAGDTVRMADNALFMVHAPWTITAGNSRDLRASADQLDAWGHAMANSYAARTGDVAAALALVTDGEDHYYTAPEALAGGFVDEITNALPIAAHALRPAGIDRYRLLPAMPAAGIPAAAAAIPQEPLMPQPKEPAANPTTAASTTTVPAQPDAAAILAADRARREAIRATFAPWVASEAVQSLQRQCEDDTAVTADAASQRLLAHLGQQAAPIAGIHTVEDEADKRRGAAVSALLVRANHASAEQRAAYNGNPYRGHTLLEIARASLEQAGRSTAGMDKRDIVGAAFTQTRSDFPVLLTEAIHRVLLSAYGVQALTWQRFCKRGQVSDFRPHNRFRVGSLGNLQPKTEAGEYKTVAIPDGEKTSITAATKGYIIGISRELVINDDLGAITDQAAAMGRSAARTVEADVYALLVSNAGLGPVLNDGKTLFHADHKNIVATGARPTTASFQDFRLAMAQQKDISGNDYLDLRPAVWLGPVGMETEAKLINQAQYEPSTSKNSLTPNVSLGLFRDVVGTPRLAGTRHYAFAEPDEAAALEVAFLDGIDTPYLEQQTEFSTDGASFKVRLDYGVAGHDFRGAATNAGA